MLRILLLIAAIVVLIWMIRGVRRGGAGSKSAARSKAAAPRRETMIACAHCGVHLPRGEAVRAGEALFCGDAHRLEFERARGGPG